MTARRLFRTKKIFSIAILGALFVALLLFRESAPLQIVRDRLLDTAIPFIRASRVTGTAFGFARDKSEAENQKVMTRIRFERDSLAEENGRLRRALDFVITERQKPITAPVIFFARDFGGESLIIGKGVRDGVHEGDYAIDDNGALVGRVKQADDTRAKIAIAANPGEAYDARIIPGGGAVLAKGIGAGGFSLELVASHMPIRVGDFLALPRGRGDRELLLGEVAQVHTNTTAALQEVLVAMSADAQMLSEAFIIPDPTR